MEAVFGLLEDGIGMALENLCGDLLASVSGEAMEDVGALSCCCDDAVIDLVRSKLLSLIHI